jgi:UPF0755 protein
MLKRLALLALVLFCLCAAFGVWAYIHTTSAYRGFSSSEVFIDVPTGASVSTIATRLADAGVVADALTFRVVARISGQDRHLQAGEYRFAEAATPAEVLDRLARGDVFTRPITVPEGLSLFEVAALVERAGLAQADAFRRAAADGSRIAAFDPDARSLEGFLFPDTYALPRSAGAEGLIAAMVDRFGRAFDADLRARGVAAVVHARPDHAGLAGGKGDRSG